MEPEDRLSDLPDCLIHHIFSFIDSLYLVRASVLARRWRHLYASTPVLSLSFINATEPINSTPPPPNLLQWVGGLLAGRRPTPRRARVSAIMTSIINKYYKYNRIFVPDTMEAFVSAAAQRGALQRLELSTDLNTFQLPACMYTTSSLKELMLRSDLIYLPRRDAVLFPFLKKLHLEHIHHLSGRFGGGRIISGCPNLETLILKNCRIENLHHKILSIAAPKLTRLSILYTPNLYDFPINDWEFVITAPMLECLNFSGDWAVNFQLASPCPLLDEVQFHLYLRNLHRIDRALSLIPMLNVFKCARTIKLSHSTHQYLSEALDLLQVVYSFNYKVFCPTQVEEFSNKL